MDTTSITVSAHLTTFPCPHDGCTANVARDFNKRLDDFLGSRKRFYEGLRHMLKDLNGKSWVNESRDLTLFDNNEKVGALSFKCPSCQHLIELKVNESTGVIFQGHPQVYSSMVVQQKRTMRDEHKNEALPNSIPTQQFVTIASKGFKAEDEPKQEEPVIAVEEVVVEIPEAKGLGAVIAQEIPLVDEELILANQAQVKEEEKKRQREAEKLLIQQETERREKEISFIFMSRYPCGSGTPH